MWKNCLCSICKEGKDGLRGGSENEIISFVNPRKNGESLLAPLLSPELTSSLRFWDKSIARINLEISHQDSSNL